MEDEYSVESLLLLARQHQSNPALLDKPITRDQVRALHAKLHGIGVTFNRRQRSQKLEIMREILGYRSLLDTTNDLTMADAFGMLGLSDTDFGTLVIWATLKIKKGVQI